MKTGTTHRWDEHQSLHFGWSLQEVVNSHVYDMQVDEYYDVNNSAAVSMTHSIAQYWLHT
jgi:hypothetical protein